jgi:hypothetical protein
MSPLQFIARTHPFFRQFTCFLGIKGERFVDIIQGKSIAAGAHQQPIFQAMDIAAKQA